MKNVPMFHAVKVAVPGVTVSSISPAPSAATALPVDASGKIPRYTRFAVSSAGYVAFGDVTVVADDTGILVVPSEAAILNTAGEGGYFSYLSINGTGVCNACPVEF